MWRVQKVNRHCSKVPVRWHVGPSTNMREYFWKSKNMNVTYLELKTDILQEICGNWRHLNLLFYKSQHAELLLLMLTFTKTNFRLWQFVIKGAVTDGQSTCFLCRCVRLNSWRRWNNLRCSVRRRRLHWSLFILYIQSGDRWGDRWEFMSVTCKEQPTLQDQVRLQTVDEQNQHQKQTHVHTNTLTSSHKASSVWTYSHMTSRQVNRSAGLWLADVASL